MRIYTLGTHHRPKFEFTRILAKYGIQVIFDLRRVPESRDEHFNRDRLQELCDSHNISYVYLGNELGGPRQTGHRAWIESEPFQRWLGIIRSKTEKRVCCLLCAERSPERCHRRTLADELARDGIEVFHILEEDRFWEPRPRTASRPRRGPRRPGPRNRRRDGRPRR